MKFAEQLKKLRQAQGLSQEDVATRLFVTRQAVSKWENGDGTPDLSTLVQLAEMLDVSLDELVLAAEPAVPQQTSTAIATARPPMNGWEFLARYWWILMALGGMVIGFLKWLR
jgi:transcriptional regulator with XRE-family HTH domain